MKLLIALFIVITSISCSTTQNVSTSLNQKNPKRSYDDLLHEYLDVAGTKSTIIKARKLMLNQISNSLERVLAERLSKSAYKNQSHQAQVTLLVNSAILNYTERFEKEQEKLMPFEVIERKIIAPIYKKHFSYADIENLIVFYKSPVGRKFVASIDTLMQEITKRISQEYGQQIYELSRNIAKEEFEKLESELKELTN